MKRWRVDEFIGKIWDRSSVQEIPCPSGLIPKYLSLKLRKLKEREAFVGKRRTRTPEKENEAREKRNSAYLPPRKIR